MAPVSFLINSFLTPTLIRLSTLLSSALRYSLVSLVNSLLAEVMMAGNPYAFDEAAPILSIISHTAF